MFVEILKLKSKKLPNDSAMERIINVVFAVEGFEFEVKIRQEYIWDYKTKVWCYKNINSPKAYSNNGLVFIEDGGLELQCDESIICMSGRHSSDKDLFLFEMTNSINDKIDEISEPLPHPSVYEIWNNIDEILPNVRYGNYLGAGYVMIWHDKEYNFNIEIDPSEDKIRNIIGDSCDILNEQAIYNILSMRELI